MTPLALSAPAVEPVSLAAMKGYLRLDGQEEDELVAALIVAARMNVEGATRLCLIEQSWRLRLERWARGRPVAVPLAPVIALLAVRAGAPGGTGVPVAQDAVRLDLSQEPARVLVDAAALPASAEAGFLEIDLLCGFGATPAAVPEPLRLAIRRLAAGWFEERGDGPAPPDGRLPAAVDALVAPFRRPRLVP